VRYEIETLISFLERLLVRASFDKDEASAIAKSLTLSERLGYSSHGIAQISRYIAELRAGNIVSGAPPKTLHETSNSLLVDAQLGVGQVVMPGVLRHAHSKLLTQASVTAAVRNCGHIGRLGEGSVPSTSATNRPAFGVSIALNCFGPLTVTMERIAPLES